MAETARAWRCWAQVEERDVLAMENAALAAELAPLSAQVEALLEARAVYTDAPADHVAVIATVRAAAEHWRGLGKGHRLFQVMD